MKKPTDNQISALWQNYAAIFDELACYYRAHGALEKANAVDSLDAVVVIPWIKEYFEDGLLISGAIQDSNRPLIYSFPSHIRKCVGQHLLDHGWPTDGPGEIWGTIRVIYAEYAEEERRKS